MLFTSVVTQLNERQAEVQENCLRTLLQSRKEKKNRSAMMTVRDPSSIKKKTSAESLLFVLLMKFLVAHISIKTQGRVRV